MKPTFLFFSALVGTLISITSCSEERINEVTAQPTSETFSSALVPKYFRGEKIMVKEEMDGTYSLMGSDLHVFKEQLSDTPLESSEDLTVPPDESSFQKAAAAYINKWPNNTVVYTVEGLSTAVRSELQQSMNEWSSKTNIRFKERTNESNYVTISSSGANSNSGVATLGMFGNRGYIQLGTRATAVVIIHEIGHTLGYIHEHNRSDRDEHVRINYQNIQDNRVDQFEKDFNANLITKQFDINSIMMYGSYTFSKNRNPTITDREGNVLPRRNARLSSLDIEGTNAFYPEILIDPDTGETKPCDGVLPWRSGTRYFLGDRVTYRNYLFEKQFRGWSLITSCTLK